MGMEQAMVPVIIEQTASPLISEGVKTALIVAGGIVVVGALAAGAYMYVNRDKNSAVTEAQNLIAGSLVQQLAEVSELRAAAMKKALAPAMAAARKEHPNELLDNPIAALAAFNAGKN